MILIGLTTLSFQAQASLYQTAYEPATAFYKSPESLFTSGYASKNELLAQVRQSFTEFNFEAAIGGKTVQVQNEQILREINVAWKVRVKKKSPLYSQADLSSPQLAQLNETQILEIESIQGAFARVKSSTVNVGFILTTNLEIMENDPGHWVNMLPLSLKFEPHANSKQKLLIPALTRMSLVSIKNGFGLFKTTSYQGYAPLADLITRADFAQYGWNNVKKSWQKILYRNGLDLIVVPHQVISIQNFTAFKGAKNRALISGDHATLAKGTRVDLVKPQAQRWTQSEIKGHGLVWWKRDLLSDSSTKETISTTDLLKRKLNGISYDSKTKKGLISAGGIYLTLDGKIWKKISFFGNDDWPVFMHPSGVWFVGTYRSTDEGKNFEPSIKYSELARILQNSGKRNRAFIHLKVLDLEPLPKSYVLMKIDTGTTIAKLKSHVLSNHWFLQP